MAEKLQEYSLTWEVTDNKAPIGHQIFQPFIGWLYQSLYGRKCTLQAGMNVGIISDFHGGMS